MNKIKVVLDGENSIKGEFTNKKEIREYWYNLSFPKNGSYTKVNVSLFFNNVLAYGFRLDMTQKLHHENFYNFFSVVKNHLEESYNYYYADSNNFKIYNCTDKGKLYNKNVVLPLINYIYKSKNLVEHIFYKIELKQYNLVYYTLNHLNIYKNIEVYKVDKNIDLTPNDFDITRYVISEDYLEGDVINTSNMEVLDEENI